MKVKLCISNIAWDSSVDEYMYKCLADNGFNGVEIAPTRVFSEHPYDHLSEAAAWSTKIKETYGLEIPSIQSIWYGRSENIFTSQRERMILFEYTKKAILFAEAVGAQNVVFGCPVNRNGYTRCEDENKKKNTIDFFRELGEYALFHNTVIGFEANPIIYQTDFINMTKEAIAFIEEVDSQGIKLNLDIGTLIYYDEKIDILENKIGMINHVQISEPRLGIINKNPIHQSLSFILKKAKYNRYVSIEMRKQDGLDAIQKSISYVKDIFG